MGIEPEQPFRKPLTEKTARNSIFMLTQSSDTHRDIETIQISMIRRESTAKKASQMCSLSQSIRQLSKRAIKRANPTLSEQELKLLFIRYLYGSDLADRFSNYLIGITHFFYGNKKDLRFLKTISRQQSNRETTATTMKQVELIAAIEPVVKAFNQLSILYYIGGSIASSVYGMPRATQDIDLVVDLKPQQIRFLVAQLESAYYIDEEMIMKALDQGTSFNLIHLDTMIKIDIFLVKDEPYHHAAFQRKRQDTLDEEENSLQFYLASSEDIILNKLDWFRIGGYVSDQQWRDIQGVLKIQQPSLDLKYLVTWAKKLGLADWLEKAFQEAGIDNNPK